MTYTHIKAKGRVAIFKDGEFDHQQFRGHWGYSNPQGYIEHLIQCDREAAEYAAECAAARRAEVDAYLARRAARACHDQLSLF